MEEMISDRSGNMRYGTVRYLCCTVTNLSHWSVDDSFIDKQTSKHTIDQPTNRRREERTGTEDWRKKQSTRPGRRRAARTVSYRTARCVPTNRQETGIVWNSLLRYLPYRTRAIHGFLAITVVIAMRVVIPTTTIAIATAEQTRNRYTATEAPILVFFVES